MGRRHIEVEDSRKRKRALIVPTNMPACKLDPAG